MGIEGSDHRNVGYERRSVRGSWRGGRNEGGGGGRSGEGDEVVVGLRTEGHQSDDGVCEDPEEELGRKRKKLKEERRGGRDDG